jgi:3-dehydroquinate dehydratase-1
MKYCLPIIANNFEELEQRLSLYNSSYDYLEVWLDYLNNSFTNDNLDELIKTYPNKLLFVTRRLNFEECTISFDRRIETIKYLATKNCLIDLDINFHKQELTELSDLNINEKLVLSFHDYQKTPNNVDLISIYNEMHKYEPLIYKFSCISNSYEDSLRLCNLLKELLSRHDKVVVLGMGKYGTYTRVIGQLLGNYMLFVRADDLPATANGQLSKKEVEQILNIIG